MNERDRAVDFRMVVEDAGPVDLFGDELCGWFLVSSWDCHSGDGRAGAVA
jgi:hypothetical protein